MGDPGSVPIEPSSENLENRSARDAFLWLVSTTIIWQVLSWILTLYTARVLSPSDYGVLALFEALFPYLLLITTLKLDIWIIKEKQFSPEKESAAFGITLALGAVCFVITLAVAPLLAWIYQQPAVLLPLQVSSVIFLLRAIQIVPEAKMRRELNLKPIAIANLVVGVTRGILQLVLAIAGFSYWSLVIGGLFREIAVSIWYLVANGWPERPKFVPAVTPGAIRFGISATVAVIFWIIFSTADNLIVGKFYGVEILGFYSMAFFLVDLPLSKLNSILSPLLPTIYGRVADDSENLGPTYLRISSGILGIVAPTLLGLAATSYEIVNLCLGEKWAPMVPMLQVLSVVGLLRAFTTNTYPLLYSIGKPNAVLRTSAFTALTLPCAFFVLGKALGIEGIYLAWLLVYPIVGIYALLRQVRLHVGIPEVKVLTVILPSVASASMMALLVWGVGRVAPFPLVVILALKVLVGSITYPLLLRTLFPATFQSGIDFLKTVRRR